jgi:hypothetical protein
MKYIYTSLLGKTIYHISTTKRSPLDSDINEVAEDEVVPH